MRFKEWMILNEVNIGEWWIGYGSLYSADDWGDTNHEGHVIQMMQSNIAEKVPGIKSDFDNVDWDKVRERIIQIAYQTSVKNIKRDPGKPGQFPFMKKDRRYYKNLYNQNPEELLEKGLQMLGISEEEFDIADDRGDARLYAIKKWGWKRVEGTNIESWTLTARDAREIIDGLSEILGGQIDDKRFDRINLSVFTHADKRNRSVTIGQLENWISRRSIQTPTQTNPMDQVARDRHQLDIDTQNQASWNYGVDQDLKNMPDYYRKKKFPFADWVLNRNDR